MYLLFLPSSAIEISKNDYADLDPLINTMINSKYTKGIQATNVLLSLRLAGILNQSQEQQLIQQVKRNVDCKCECLQPPEDLEDLPIHMVISSKRPSENIVCPKYTCHIYPSCRKFEGTEKSSKH